MPIKGCIGFCELLTEAIIFSLTPWVEIMSVLLRNQEEEVLTYVVVGENISYRKVSFPAPTMEAKPRWGDTTSEGMTDGLRGQRDNYERSWFNLHPSL